MPPDDFSEWIRRIDIIRDTPTMKFEWKAEPVYSACEPIQRIKERLAIILTILKKTSAMHSPARNLGWSSTENHSTMFHDAIRQGQLIRTLLQDHLQLLSQNLDTIRDQLVAERRRYQQHLEGFENADDNGKDAMVSDIWYHLMESESPSRWEESWHKEQMGLLRVIMRSHLTKPILRP